MHFVIKERDDNGMSSHNIEMWISYTLEVNLKKSCVITKNNYQMLQSRFFLLFKVMMSN